MLCASLQHAQAGPPKKKKESPQLKRLRLAASKQLARDGQYSAAAQKAFVAYIESVTQHNPHGNIMGVIFLVFRDSIEEQNEDKRYWLERLKEQDAIADALGDYLEELASASRDLEAEVRGDKEAEASVVDMRVAGRSIDQLTDRNKRPTKNVRAVLDRSRKKKKLTRVRLKRCKKDLEDLRKRLKAQKEVLRRNSTAAANQAKKLRKNRKVIEAKMRADVEKVKRRLKKR
jgi:hypothetical protein